MLPVYALLSGGVVTTTLECHKRCTGTVTLSLIGGHLAAAAGRAGAARGATVLGRLAFALPANKRKALRIPLNPTGRRRLKKVKALPVRMTVALKLAHAKKATSYSQTILLTKRKPSVGKLKPKKVP